MTAAPPARALMNINDPPRSLHKQRSSYRRVRRTSALPAPAEAHSEVLNGQALHEGLTDITMNHKLQATRAQVLDVRDAQELVSPPSAHVNSTTEHVHLTTAISLPSGSNSVFDRRGRKSKSEWQAYAAPQDEGTYPAVSAGTEVGALGPLEPGTQASVMTAVGRQALWWGAELVSPCPPKTLCMPATSCPVTTMAWSWECHTASKGQEDCLLAILSYVDP